MSNVPDAKKPGKKIVNPYAKKAGSTSNKRAAASTNQQGSGPHVLRPVEIGASATFSQAFASVEDTSHFQNEQSKLKKGNTNNTLVESWAKQRTFDETAAAENAAAEALMSDRDHHALMQPHVLYVSTKQRGNGILKHIRNVPFQFSKMVPDYIMTSSRCALFLSIKYHNLYPNYIHRRIAELKTDFVLRVLLVLVDVEDNANTLLFLNKLAVVNNFTLVLAWSEEEAARYLETYKAFDGKDASSIQRREQTHFCDQVADVLTSVKSVNKTDAAQLLSQFSSLKAVVAASMDELCLCPGLGQKKVRRLHDAFHKPFSSRQAKRRRKEEKLAATEEAQKNHAVVTGKGQQVESKPKAKGNEDATQNGVVPDPTVDHDAS